MKHIPIYYVLMKKANSDLKVALRELSNIDPELEIVCFHFQQFVEKYLKAYLFFMGGEPKKIHNIVFLLNECIAYNGLLEKFKDSKIIELNECGVDIRYEETDEIEIEFIEEVKETVIKLKTLIDKLIVSTIDL